MDVQQLGQGAVGRHGDDRGSPPDRHRRAPEDGVNTSDGPGEQVARNDEVEMGQLMQGGVVESGLVEPGEVESIERADHEQRTGHGMRDQAQEAAVQQPGQRGSARRWERPQEQRQGSGEHQADGCRHPQEEVLQGVDVEALVLRHDRGEDRYSNDRQPEQEERAAMDRPADSPGA